ncbi:unnamed protein product [Absidia cylindrospora]
MSGNNIKVVCRFRPQNKLEIKEGGVPIIELNNEGTSVTLKGETQSNYAFDKVFGSNTRQEEVFDYSIKSIVDDVVAGYNGTVFAYGQTGSGKTFTMMGSDIDDAENKGIIPRIVEQIFESIMLSPDNMEFTVKVSYMEIYMEKVRDLLNPSMDNLAIHEDKVKGVYVKGVLEVYVSSTEEVYDVMRRGGSNRVVAYTNMNAESSRSHSLVLITITQKNVDTGAAKSGKLYLVDLAGSEKVGKTGASGQTLEEAKKINKSLTALGMVINSLTDGKSSHIPYRDSKLTRILQESLGGNSRTTLIINCSPSSYNEAETISTLRFGVRAKTIKNQAKVNADLSPAELKALLKKVKGETVTYRTYITALEGEIGIWRSGGTVPEAQWATLGNATTAGLITNGATPEASNTGRQTPTSNGSQDPSRPFTPSIALEKDERDQFLERENELLQLISEKETELSNREKHVQDLQDELNQRKDHERTIVSDNQKMTSELGEAKIQLEKIMYENKEGLITADSLKEANQELAEELERLRQALAKLQEQQQQQEIANKDTNKNNLMTSSTSTQVDESVIINEKEKVIAGALQRISDSPTVSSDEVISLQKELTESKALVDHYQTVIRELGIGKELLTKKQVELETNYSTLESEYEAQLEKAVQEEEHQQDSLAAHKTMLEQKYAAKRESHTKELEDLKKQLQWKDQQEGKLAVAIAELKMVNEELQDFISCQPDNLQPPATSPTENAATEKDVEAMRKSMAQQLADFDMMKKALMRDLQSRCERVVDLEITLDETREQYANVLRATNNKAQQKKMVFLERNLEQLTNVQKQLVEQNSHLKKEMSFAERKLLAKNERIQNLEGMLHEAQEKLNSQTESFELKMQALRDRLEMARTNQRSNTSFAGFSRIAKPLRGGVSVQDSTDKRDKRSSWLPF